MSQAPPQPLLLVDIDGVISLFGFDPAAPPPGAFHTVDGMLHYLSAGAGPHLCELAGAFELAWCSGWEEKANEYLPHLLGLPGELPYLSFDRSPQRSRAHWKLEAIDAFAGARALAWLDDALDEHCERWAGARAAPTLLVRTRPEVGVGAPEVARLLAWAASTSR
jgi:hypothetical protein